MFLNATFVQDTTMNQPDPLSLFLSFSFSTHPSNRYIFTILPKPFYNTIHQIPSHGEDLVDHRNLVFIKVILLIQHHS